MSRCDQCGNRECTCGQTSAPEVERAIDELRAEMTEGLGAIAAVLREIRDLIRTGDAQ